MGKNALTSWLVVTAKDFKVLFRNRSLLLIYTAISLSIMLLALFIGIFLFNIMLQFFPATDYLPALPNYMLSFVIVVSSVYLISQGAVSITEENEKCTIDRLLIMNVSPLSIYFGKFVFFYLITIIQVILFNLVCTICFWNVQGTEYMNWTVPDILMYVLVWPFFMVLGAALLYALITLIRRATKTGK